MRSTMIALAFAIACARLLAPTAMRAQTVSTSQHRVPVIVASKPFGESYLLAEMFAQTLEAHGMTVDRRLGLGQTQIAIDALRSGAIDVYPEYTGTGLLAVLHDTLSDSLASDARLVFVHVEQEFATRYGMRWLPPLGFQNSYAIAVRKNTATQYHLRTLSDLARESSHLTAGFTADFIGRPDGLGGLARAYGVARDAGAPPDRRPAAKRARETRRGRPDTQRVQLAFDPQVAPPGVLRRHLKEKLGYRRIDRRAAGRAMRPRPLSGDE